MMVTALPWFPPLRIYRADGMRVRKQNQVGLAFDGSLAFNLTNNHVTRTYYEGQMPLEEEVIRGGSVQSLTRNFLGGRGLEAITTTDNSVTTTAYPLYDTHGNMVATLTKNASGTSWNVGNERSYDVWGGVRLGAATGGPKGRYCANLGHVQDDESGLVYMRARYYEPSTGRFVSEDPVNQGWNWFVYCLNNPVARVDPTGTMFVDLLMQSMDSLKNNVTAGNVARAGGKWGEDKVMEITAYHMGRLIGICVAMEIDIAGRSGAMTISDDGNLRYRWNNANMQMDLKNTHVGMPHADLRGALSKYEGWFKSQFGTKGIPLEQFAAGFWDGFF